MLATFTGELFRHADPNTFIITKAFEDGAEGPPVFPAQPIGVQSKARDRIIFAQAKNVAKHPRAGVFAPPVCTFKDDPTRPRGAATLADVANGLSISVDADKSPGAALVTLTGILGRPTLVVESGGVWANPETGEAEPKLHLHWRLEAGSVTRTAAEHARLQEARMLACRIVGGDPTLAPLNHPLRWAGSVHRKGVPRLAAIVERSEAELDLDAALTALRGAYTGPALERVVSDGSSLSCRSSGPATTEDIASALAEIPNDGVSWDEWNRIGMAAWGGSGGTAFDAFAAWSAKSSKHKPRETAARWTHFGRSPPGSIGAGALFHMANAANPSWVRPSSVVAPLWSDAELAILAQSSEPANDDAPGGSFALSGSGTHREIAANPIAVPAGGGKQKRRISATPYVALDHKTFPRRRWVYGRHMLRKVASVTYAPGGVGKTTLVLSEAICLALGKSLLGPTCHEGPLKVWVINLEDPLEELQRKVIAICLHFGIDQRSLEGQLFLDSGKDTPVCLATQGKDGVQIAIPEVKDMEATIKDNGIDVVILDPFISAHKVGENDNTAVDVVAKLFGTIADRTNCAMELVHHTRKVQGGGANTVEDGRGASALLYAVRSARVLNGMSQEEADRAGVGRARDYFRVTAGKGNFAPVEGSDWYKLESVSLDNDGDGPMAEPDSVGVATPWQWPDVLADVTVADLRKVQAVVALGRFRESVQAGDWVGNAVAEVLKLDPSAKASKARISSLLKVWISTGMLKITNGTDAKGMTRKFVEVGTPAND